MKKAEKKVKKKADKAKKGEKPGRKEIDAMRKTQDAGLTVAANKRKSAEFDDGSKNGR